MRISLKKKKKKKNRSRRRRRRRIEAGEEEEGVKLADHLIGCRWSSFLSIIYLIEQVQDHHLNPEHPESEQGHRPQRSGSEVMKNTSLKLQQNLSLKSNPVW